MALSESPAERHREVAAGFGGRVRGARDWEAPAPVEGWTARDVVRHLVEWFPAFLRDGGVELGVVPSFDDDPVAAWQAHADAVQALLDAPDADRPFTHPRAGSHQLSQAVDSFYTSDVFMHTWDLARATGQDDTLDADEAERMLSGMLPLDDMLRASGQYGPKVPVSASAPAHERLMAFVGRDPAWPR